MVHVDATSEATRVLIVDDHRMFADSLVRVLSDEPDLVVVDVANNIADAVEAVAMHAPDVVLLDYRLPDGDAPDCITQMLNAAPHDAGTCHDRVGR